jgi:hypothetical protein
MACVQRGLYLVSGASPLAILFHGPDDFGMRRAVSLAVMAGSKSDAKAFLASLRKAMRAHRLL